MGEIQEIKLLCEQYGIYPSKTRGQNFVIDPGVIRMMTEAAELSAEDCVVEIGPGFGALTAELAKRVKKVVAVEVDKNVFSAAKDILAEYKNVDLVQGDILKIPNEELTRQLYKAELLPAAQHKSSALNKYKIVSNLPYSITSKVLRKFTEFEPRPSLIVLMVQKEVAERVCAKPGEMSILSVAVQYYGQPELVAFIPRTAFWPEPEVDSAILRIETVRRFKAELLPNQSSALDNFEKRLFQIVRIGFSSRRKQLQNNLTSGLRLPRVQVLAALRQIGLTETVRPQELAVSDWIALVKVI